MGLLLTKLTNSNKYKILKKYGTHGVLVKQYSKSNTVYEWRVRHLKTVRYFVNDVLHRDKTSHGKYGPAEIEYTYDSPMEKKWMINGKLHNLNGSYALAKYAFGYIQRRQWYNHGILHRDGDKPASITYFSKGQLKAHYWMYNGWSHRDGDKPACVYYFVDGSISGYTWFKHGLQHRTPTDKDYYSSADFYKSGEIKHAEWTYNNKFHNTTGPAKISHHKGRTESIKEYYYIDDIQMSKTLYHKRINIMLNNCIDMYLYNDVRNIVKLYLG